jgi:2,3-bisphosphoglycerate-independent phosphoglycerate mutase
MFAETTPRTPLVLCILDGVGHRVGSGSDSGNAIEGAEPEFWNQLFADYNSTTLKCKGLDVGLPEGQMGNSEVGHLTIGSGRVIDQDLNRVSRAFDGGTISDFPEWRATIEVLQASGGTLHLLGLVSPGGVHSHTEHLKGIVRTAKSAGLDKIAIHAFLDGRDTDPESGLGYLTNLQSALDEIGAGVIASVSGRYWSMDRDKRWDRVKKSWDMLVHGQAEQGADALEVVRASYSAGKTDEFLEPTIILDDQGAPKAVVQDGDAVFFWNFRADRARELTWAFMQDDFDGFERPVRPKISYLTMTVYDASMDLPVLFKAQTHQHILADVFVEHGITNLRTAETEKYAHVTYFFNGGNEEPFKGEDRRLVASPKVATYDLQPEMSAPEVAAIVLESLREQQHDVIIVNFANGDMVGHTGVYDAAVSAFKTLDGLLAMIVPEVLKRNGVMLITADHGNCEEMLTAEGRVLTNHSLNEVPFLVVGRDVDGGPIALENDDFSLRDIAPTMLDVLGLPQPEAMTGKSIISNH